VTPRDIVLFLYFDAQITHKDIQKNDVERNRLGFIADFSDFGRK